MHLCNGSRDAAALIEISAIWGSRRAASRPPNWAEKKAAPRGKGGGLAGVRIFSLVAKRPFPDRVPALRKLKPVRKFHTFSREFHIRNGMIPHIKRPLTFKYGFDTSRIMEIKSTTAVDALSALAQEHRLALFRLLVQAGEDGMAAGAIAEALGLPNSSLSFHLAHLNRAGLIRQERQGRSLVYRADYGAMNGLISYLMENCCGGLPCAPNAACRAEAAPVSKQRKLA